MVSKSNEGSWKALFAIVRAVTLVAGIVIIGACSDPDADKAILYNPQEGPRLVRAIDAGDYVNAKRYIEEGDDVNQHFPKGIPLIFAAVGAWEPRSVDFQVHLRQSTTMPENLMILKLLLESGAPADTTMENGVTPLGYAAGAGNLGYMYLLLLHGADPDRKDKQGYSPRCDVSRALKHEALKLIEMFDDQPVDCPGARFERLRTPS
jgi:hypothetical protein